MPRRFHFQPAIQGIDRRWRETLALKNTHYKGVRAFCYFVAWIYRISPDVLNKIDERRFQPGVLSCLSSII